MCNVYYQPLCHIILVLLWSLYERGKLSPDSPQSCPVVRRLDPSDVTGCYRVRAAWWISSLGPAEHSVLTEHYLKVKHR